MSLYRCYAKINLSLEVLKRRPDGYHDLASVAHTIGLADDLTIEPADQIVLRTEGIDLPTGDNLVVRAARLLASTAGSRAGARLTLRKRIPAAAGLGGGSSDAAAALLGLNTLWNTRLGCHALPQLAAQLGSDVPFFLRGGAALMAGRGDELRGLRALEDQWLVLLSPPIVLPNKTAAVYAALEPRDFTDGEHTRRLADRLDRGIPPHMGDLVNTFERPARALFPGLADVWRRVEAVCGRRFSLSGAGPSLFSLAADRSDARHLAARLSEAGFEAFALPTVRHAQCSRRPAIEYA